MQGLRSEVSAKEGNTIARPGGLSRGGQMNNSAAQKNRSMEEQNGGN
jgi:hypothetical protein